MRAHERPFFKDPNRRRLVGLLTEDPQMVLPDGGQITEVSEEQAGSRPLGTLRQHIFHLL